MDPDNQYTNDDETEDSSEDIAVVPPEAWRPPPTEEFIYGDGSLLYP